MRMLLLPVLPLLALAQSDRVLTFAAETPARERLETATVLRSIADPAGLEVTADGLVARGPEEVVRLAEWIFQRLDRRTAMPQEMFVIGNERVRLFPFEASVTPAMLREAATAIRQQTEAARLFVHEPSRVLAVRADEERLDLAAWLARQFTGEGGDPVRRAGSTVLRVFPVTLDRGPLQELATVVRSLTDVPRLFALGAWGRLTVRGTAEQIRAVEWLVPALLAPGPRQQAFGGEAIRLFDVTGVTDRQAKATAIRQATKIPRLFVMNTPPVLAVRGTPEQLAAVEKLLAQ